MSEIDNKALDEAKDKVEKIAISIVENEAIWKQLKNKQFDSQLSAKFNTSSELLKTSQQTIKGKLQAEQIKALVNNIAN